MLIFPVIQEKIMARYAKPRPESHSQPRELKLLLDLCSEDVIMANRR